MLIVRLFVSSPGDVGAERVTAQRVIARLQGEFGRSVDLQPFFWEHEPLRATQHFQEQIVSPADCDIVVCILWKRLGTRLPASFHRPDGSTYSSGTEWEFETAAQAYRTRGIPDLLTYRNAQPPKPSASLNDEAALEEERRQFKALDAFIKRWFEEEGAFKAAFKTYLTTADFEKLLEEDLRKLIAERLPSHLSEQDHINVRWHKGSPFRGLEAFGLEHAEIFFGRTRAIGEVKQALVNQAAGGCGFVLIFGGSGVGKSSLVRAGVLPTITQPGVIEGVAMWRWCVLRPSDIQGDLCDGLARALLGADALPEAQGLAFDARELGALFREAPQRAVAPLHDGLARAAEGACGPRASELRPSSRGWRS